MSNPLLVNKVKDLDKLLNEYEFNFSSFKLKQQSLEKRIEVLEREFNKIKQKPLQNITNSTNTETHLTGKKLIAIEESHRILEKELKLLRDLQASDLESIKDNIDSLQTQIFGEVIISSQSLTNFKDANSVDFLQKQCAEIQERLNQIRKRKQDNSDMEKNYGELKSEMRTQFNNLVEERRLFELEKELLSKDLGKLNENTIIKSASNVIENVIIVENTNSLSESMIIKSLSSQQDILNSTIIQESILELEQKADEWEHKYKNELDTFNMLSQQQDMQIKQLKEQLLTAKINNEAKNLDLTNQLKLLNSDDVDEMFNKNINIIESSIGKENLNEEQKLIASKYPSVNNFLENELNKHSLTSNELNDVNNATITRKKSNLTESIMELEGKLNEWGHKYNKEIDVFNKQQKEQILLNKKEETQIKLLKEQITAAKLVNDSDETLTSLNNTKRSTIKESILNLEAKFNQLEKIYNNESSLLDNQLKSISSSNLFTSNSNLKEFSNQNLKFLLNTDFIKETQSKLDHIEETKSIIPNFKSEHDFKINKSNSAETIFVLEAKIDEWEKKHHREIEIFNILSKQQEIQIKELKEKLTTEALQVEALNSDYCLLQAEANRLENALRIKCENLENELNETNKLNEYECEIAMKNKKYNQTYENYDKEIKTLVDQISHLQKGLKIKEDEFQNLEKLIEIERLKTTTLVKQIDDLNCINIQLNMQNSEAKSRLVTLDLLTDECIQLRKNLTFIKLKA